MLKLVSLIQVSEPYLGWFIEAQADQTFLNGLTLYNRHQLTRKTINMMRNKIKAVIPVEQSVSVIFSGAYISQGAPQSSYVQYNNY